MDEDEDYHAKYKRLLELMQREIPELQRICRMASTYNTRLDRRVKLLGTQEAALKEQGFNNAAVDVFQIRRLLALIMRALEEIVSKLQSFINSVGRGLAHQGDEMETRISFLNAVLRASRISNAKLMI